MSSPTGRAVCAFLLVSLALVSFAFGLAQSQSTTEVRINARQLDSGRVEFALQQREGAGWSERILLPGRFLPADVGHDRWLKTAPYTVSVPLPEPKVEAKVEDEGPCVLSGHTNRVAAATFQVQTGSATGTAFYIGRDEWLTNHHVVDGVAEVRLVRGEYTILATVLGSLPGHDLALLRAPAPYSVTPLGFARERQSLGSDVSVLGYPPSVSGTPSLTRGVVSKHSPFSEFSGFAGRGLMVQIDAAINPGNSGGPMINDCGEVVGIATLKLFSAGGLDVEGIGYGVAGETVVAQLPALRTTPHDAQDSVPGNDETPGVNGARFGAEFKQWSDNNTSRHVHRTGANGHWQTEIALFGTSDHSTYSESILVLTCVHNPEGEYLDVGASAHVPGVSESVALLDGTKEPIFLIWRSGGPAGDHVFGFVSANREQGVINRDEAQGLLSRGKATDDIAASLPRTFGKSIIVTFDFESVIESPVQHLFERCLD